MRYGQAASDWRQALPLGNGRMAQMVFGGAADEQIFLDECSFWSGKGEPEENVRGNPGLVAQIRKALFARDYASAKSLTEQMCGVKGNYGTNLPAGVLHIDMPDAAQFSRYERSLDLYDGLASARFEADGARFTRRCFCSHPDDVFALRVETDKPGALNLDVYYRENDVPASRGCAGGDLVFDIRALETRHSDGTCGVRLRGMARILHTGGALLVQNETLTLRGACV